MAAADGWHRGQRLTGADEPGPVTIVLIDDHAILRQGLRLLLDREHDLQVVGEARSPDEALVVVERTRPTVVLLDMKLSAASGNDGPGLCAELTRRHPGLRVLVLSTFVDDALVVDAIQHGASGYVVKDVDTTELLRAIRLVARKGSAFDSRSAAAMMRTIHAPQPRSTLTEREVNVLRLVAGGLSNRGIGGRLHLSETTVKFHLRNIMRKLGAASRAEAVYKATRTGLDLGPAGPAAPLAASAGSVRAGRLRDQVPAQPDGATKAGSMVTLPGRSPYGRQQHPNPPGPPVLSRVPRRLLMLQDIRPDAALAVSPSGTGASGHPDPAQGTRQAEDAPIADELLVEEVSIDGMCGVY